MYFKFQSSSSSIERVISTNVRGGGPAAAARPATVCNAISPSPTFSRAGDNTRRKQRIIQRGGREKDTERERESVRERERERERESVFNKT